MENDDNPAMKILTTRTKAALPKPFPYMTYTSVFKACPGTQMPSHNCYIGILIKILIRKYHKMLRNGHFEVTI